MFTLLTAFTKHYSPTAQHWQLHNDTATHARTHLCHVYFTDCFHKTLFFPLEQTDWASHVFFCFVFSGRLGVEGWGGGGECMLSYLSISIIHPTLKWMTRSLTCISDLFACTYIGDFSLYVVLPEAGLLYSCIKTQSMTVCRDIPLVECIKHFKIILLKALFCNMCTDGKRIHTCVWFRYW